MPLTKAVVTKGDVNLREGVGVQSAVKRAIPPGEVLEIIGTSPGQTWLEVRHPVFGSGFISGDLVEPALVRVSRVISFDNGSVELTNEAEQDFLATFGLLGGVVIADAFAEYPNADSTLGFARASIVTKRFQDIVNNGNKNQKMSELFMPIVTNMDKEFKGDTVRVTVLGFPLDQTTRASLAKVSSSLSTLNLDIIPPSSTTEPTKSPIERKSGLITYCNSAGENCRVLGIISNNEIANAYKNVWGAAQSSIDYLSQGLKALFR